MRISTLFILLLVITGACSCPGGKKDLLPERVVLQAADGMNLGATLYRPAGESLLPGLILVHRYGGNRAVWEGFARAACHAGLLVVAPDLRGHGESAVRDGKPLPYSGLSEAEILNSLQDIEAAKNHLLAHGADPQNLALAGEGLGANLALRYTLQAPDIQAVVMISPGLEYNGIETEDAICRLRDCPALLVATEGDAYSALSASTLKQNAPVFAELRTWPGASHGVDLFAAHPESMHFILQWLGSILDGK
ncbi:MAG: Alpha/beta hydrolase family protein [Candidatus Hydrogenedentes bacterium ADurb.Bin101]|nr:MAG: Alpha/beta hydrolase family protein [Candidatus Hydrogenedentes bacterium ADurb.Bin101]